MLFEPDSSIDDLIRCQTRLDDGNWQDDVIGLPDELVNFSYSFFKTKVKSMEKSGGYFDEKEQVLCISPENLEDDSVILHEMIICMSLC